MIADRLLHGGLPWKLTKRISNEIGSISQLNELYETCCHSARNSLMCPIIENSFPLPRFEKFLTTVASWSQAVCHPIIENSFPLPRFEKFLTTVASWSQAVFRVWYSAVDDPKVIWTDFEKHKGLMENCSTTCISDTHEFALSSIGIVNVLPWCVHIELTAKLEHCFPTLTGTKQTF